MAVKLDHYGVGWRARQAVAHHLEERIAPSHGRAVRGGVAPVQPPELPTPPSGQRLDVAVARAVVGAGLDGAAAVVA